MVKNFSQLPQNKFFFLNTFNSKQLSQQICNVCASYDELLQQCCCDGFPPLVKVHNRLPDPKHVLVIHSAPNPSRLFTDTVFCLVLSCFPPTLPGKEGGLLGLVLSYRSDVAVTSRDWKQCWMERVGCSAVSVFNDCSCGRCCLC